MDIMEILQPAIITIVAAITGVVGSMLAVLLKKGLSWLKIKIGADVYDQAYEVAEGLYIYLEDKYGNELRKMGDVKKKEMEEMLLEKFPTLTQTELDAINKSVWLGFNSQWYEENSKQPLSIETETKRIDE